MPQTGTKAVILTVALAVPPVYQEVLFPGLLDWIRVENDSPNTINIIDHAGQTILHLLPFDMKTLTFGNRDFNSLLLNTDVVSTAGDIALGNILYIHYKLKKREA